MIQILRSFIIILYINKEKKSKSKSRKQNRSKLNLIKSTERDKLKEEIEFQKAKELELVEQEVDSKVIEAKDEEISRQKSEIDVLNITIKHLHDVLKEKTDITMEQQREIIALNQKINQLSFENTQLRAQNSLMSRKINFDEPKFEYQMYEPNSRSSRDYMHEESKNLEAMKDTEKLRLIEETEQLLSHSKGNYLENATLLTFLNIYHIIKILWRLFAT